MKQPGVPSRLLPSHYFGENIRLLGFDLEPGDYVSVPTTLKLNLYWQAGDVPTEDYTVFVQMLNDEGRLVAQTDGQPVDGNFPTSYWEGGEIILDRHEVDMHGPLPFGKYKLIAGLYTLADGKRLTLSTGQDHAVLAELEIGTATRQ
jgi:hypothetical protein